MKYAIIGLDNGISSSIWQFCVCTTTDTRKMEMNGDLEHIMDERSPLLCQPNVQLSTPVPQGSLIVTQDGSRFSFIFAEEGRLHFYWDFFYWSFI